MTAGLSQVAAQMTINNTIVLRQRMNVSVHAVVNNIAHKRGVAFVNDDKAKGGVSSPHAAVAALTEGLSKIVLRRMKGAIISVGGTAYDHLNNGWHVCQLDDDGRNAPRFNTYINQARQAKDNPRAAGLLADIISRGKANGDAMCFEGGYKCKRSANVLFFNNSHYDISFQQLSQMMVAHGAPQCIMIGIHPREMLIDELYEHENHEFGIVWRKERKGLDINLDGNVCVGFKDGSNAYTHKLSDYTKWITTTCWSSGHLNLILECDFWGPLAIIDVTLTNRPARIARHIGMEKPLVMYPDFKYFASRNGLSHYKPSRKFHFLDAQIFASLESYAMSKTDVAWTFPTFAGYTKAQATCMTLTDGEWKNYGTHSPLHQLTGDGAVSAFIWFSAERAARSQQVGKAFNAISAELKEEMTLTNKIFRRLVKCYTDMRLWATPEFVAEMMKYSDLVEPVLETIDGCWIFGRVSSVEATFLSAPFEHVEIAEDDDSPKLQVDADIAAEAIQEYRGRIAPLELANAEAEIAVRDENDPTVAMYKVVVAATNEAIRSEYKTYEGSVEVVVGGPGTGKTQYEAENILGNDIIFVPTRIAKQELEARLKILNKSNAVYTNHAGLVYALREAGNKHEGCKLWVDEAFMQYPGMALLAAAAVRSVTVVFVGDTKQIRAKDFCSSGAQIQAHHFLKKAKLTELRNNYRNPPQVVEMLNRFFAYNMVAKSPVVGTMEIQNYDGLLSIIEVPSPRIVDKTWRIITFTQEVKNWFVNRGYNANTAHEFQGASDRRTALIVTNDLERVFLDDLGYFIVGYSRCTEKLLVCKVKVIEGVEFRDIKIGNTDLEALTDLFSPVACVSVTPEAKIQELPLRGSQAHFNHNFSISDIADTFDAYWFAAHPYTHHIRSVYKTRVPNAAESVRIRPQLINSIETTVEIASFSDYSYLADQDGGSMLAMIETFVSRNGGGRILMDRKFATQIATIIVDRTRRKLFGSEIKPLTLDELSMGFERFVRKTIQRGKSEHYINAELTDLDRLQAFMKTQLKSKWEPTRENFQSMYEEAQRGVYGAAMEGKAGQGVIGWSKPLCFVFASWINAIEERYLKELRPWVVYATQLGEEELVGRINSVLRKYHKCVLVKGDDVSIVFMDENGQMQAISWDAAKFDSTQAAVVMAAQALVMWRYGMPEVLVSYYYNFMENNNIKSLGKILEMTLHFCRHSGGMETLWGNTNHSMNMIGLVMEFDNEGDWRTAKFSDSGMHIMKAALGASLKVHQGPIGDFVGYIIQDFSLRPDIFRLSAKVISRKFALGTSVPNGLKANYEQEYPALRNHRQPGMLSLYHNIVEYSQAVRDRLSTIVSEDDRLQTIRANAALYMPEVPPVEAHARISVMLDALATFGNRKFTYIYFEVLRRRIMTKFLLPIENDADQEDQSHVIMDRDSCERVVTDLHLVDNAVKRVEEYQYATDDGWDFGIRHKVEVVTRTVAKAWWRRLLDAICARIVRSRFAGKLWWLTWLINKLRPRDESPLVETAYPVNTDVEAPTDDPAPTATNPATNAIEERFERSRGFVDFYEAIEKRVISCLAADEKCTKTFADFRGVRKYESGAAYKLLDCLTPEQEAQFVDSTNVLTVCDIGAAPGGCTQVFCEFAGIHRVIAINAPSTHPGALQMRYAHPKVDLRTLDVTTLSELPEAEYYFCDVQNLPSSKIIEILAWAHEHEKPIAIKCNHLDDQLAARLVDTDKILKPRRSNRYSSEFYILSYEHDDATGLAAYLARWGENVRALEERRLPNPYVSEDNELMGRGTPILDEAYKQITGKERTIRSAVALSDLLRHAGINFRITQNHQTIHENDKGVVGRHWEIDLDRNEVEVIEDAEAAKRKERQPPHPPVPARRKRKSRDSITSSGGSCSNVAADESELDRDLELANEAEQLAADTTMDWTAVPPAFASAYVSLPESVMPAQSEIVYTGPIFEELYRSIVSNWSCLNPIGFAHIESAFYTWRQNYAIWREQLWAVPVLFGMPNNGFIQRVLFHMAHNRLVLGSMSAHLRLLLNAFKAYVLADGNHFITFFGLGISIHEFMHGPKPLSIANVFNSIMSLIQTYKACRQAYREGLGKTLKVAFLGLIFRQFNSYFRGMLPRWTKFNIVPTKDRLADYLVLIPTLEQLGIEYETPQEDWDTIRLNAWSIRTNEAIMGAIQAMTEAAKGVANSSVAKMNVYAHVAHGTFAPVSSENKVDCLVTFDGPQPIKPVTFDGPQPIQPVEFEGAQPVYFEEAQHVIVDESASDKILDLLGNVVSLVVKDGKSEQSAFRIASNGVPLPIDNGGGIASEVTIVGSRGNLPVEIKAPLPVPVSSISSAVWGDIYLARAVATFNVSSYGVIDVGSKWASFRTDQNAGSSNENITQALVRLGLTDSASKAIKPFYMRFSATHSGYTASLGADYTTTRPVVLNWQTTQDLTDITLRVNVGVNPQTVTTPASGGHLLVALSRNQNDLYDRNMIAIYCNIFVRD